MTGSSVPRETLQANKSKDCQAASTKEKVASKLRNSQLAHIVCFSISGEENHSSFLRDLPVFLNIDGKDVLPGETISRDSAY